MLKIEDFFGLLIEDARSDIEDLLENLGINKVIDSTKLVKTLIKNKGRGSSIVNVARRQQVLKLIRPLLNAEMLDYEANYYVKEVNTSSEHDRRYGAEERLLEFALLVSSTKSKNMMAEDPKILTLKQLREAAFQQSRFDKCWDILSQESRQIVAKYRKSK